MRGWYGNGNGLNAVGINEDDDHLNTRQSICRGVIDRALGVPEIEGFVQILVPCSGTLEIQPCLDVLQNNFHTAWEISKSARTALV